MSGGPARALSCPSCGGPLDPERRACVHCRSVCSTRRCAACLALNIAGDRNCRACGRLLPAETRITPDKAVACAACGAAMVRRQSGTSSFDECDRCGGLWLSPDTLAAINTQAETRADLRPFDQPSAGQSSPLPKGTAAASYRKCPLCRKHMNRDAFATGSGVVLDLCRQHGCFLDNGEMTRLLGFIESGGLEKARQRDAESLKAEIIDLKRRKVMAGAGPAEIPVQWDAGSTPAIDVVRWIAEAFLRRG